MPHRLGRGPAHPPPQRLEASQRAPPSLRNCAVVAPPSRTRIAGTDRGLAAQWNPPPSRTAHSAAEGVGVQVLGHRGEDPSEPQ